MNVAALSRAERRKIAPELVAAWDKEHPDDSYEGNTREFWKAYHRARQAVISPTYEWRGESYTPPKNPPAAKRLRSVGTDRHGAAIFAGKWYLLHETGYTGYFDSREEAEADPRSENSRVLTSEELVAHLADRMEAN